MNIADVMDELSTTLQGIEGLRVFPFWVQSPTPPAAIVEWPNPLTFDSTMRRGSDTLVFPISLIVGKVDARSSRDALSQYADGSGDTSVKAVLEAHEYSSADSIRVQSVEFGVVTIAGVDYLSGRFQVHVVGSGI